MKKIIFALCLFFSTQAFSHEVTIHLTTAAQTKIDSGVDRWVYGPTNTDAFNVTVELVPQQDPGKPKDQGANPFCGFKCANPHRFLHGNCQSFFRPSFSGNSLSAVLDTNKLNPDYIGDYPTFHITFESKTSTLKNVSLPKNRIVNFNEQESSAITIDFTDKQGFFIVGDQET